jgi:hypothetical protein
MKKLIIFAIAMLTLSAASAQTNVPQEVNYYGVDFSKTRTFGAAETGQDFALAFERINLLIIGEWSKYNPAARLRKKIYIQDISVTQNRNSEIDPDEIATTTLKYALTDADIAEMVKKYDIKESEGTGLVFIGELLNKQTATGVFSIVYFDIASRDVLYRRTLGGAANGFGLRNYWAGSLYRILEVYRKVK